MDAESEPFEDPIETEETQPLSLRTAPLSPDYTLASPDYTPDTPHLDEESEPIKASTTRTASPSDYTSPLSPNNQLTHTSPTPTPSRAFYYHCTARMAMRTQPILSPGIFARVTEAASLSLSSFCKRYRSSYETPSSSPSLASSTTLPIRKRYRGTFEPIFGTKTEDGELEVEGTSLRSEESKDEGPGSEGEEAAPEQQQQAVLVEDTIADEPLGLGYQAAKRRALELVEDPAPSTFETPASPEWSSDSLLVSLASLTIPSPVASPVTTPAAIIAVDEDEFIEGMGRDINELYDRSAAVRGEIHSQHFRLVSLELGQEQATIRCLVATRFSLRGLGRTDKYTESGSMAG
ncbi:hypothetical protein Tco_1347953 [Tanacetum coccineum]